MTVLSTIPNGASMKDIRDTMNALLTNVAALMAGGTPTPAPSFSTSASITSDGTPQVGETLTGNDGVVSGGTVTARQWLLGSRAINGATSSTFVPTQTGAHSFRVTATGPGGTTTSTSTITVAAASSNPAPSFTTSPSITTDGTPQVGETLAGVDGTITNGNVSGRRWLFNGSQVATTSNYAPTQTGVHTFEVTATGAGGTTTATATVTVASAGSAATVDNTVGTSTANTNSVQGFAALADELNTQLVSQGGSAVTYANRALNAVLADFDAAITAREVDLAKPTLTIGPDIEKVEGNSGATLYTYPVTRDKTAGALTVAWSFATGNMVAADFTGDVLPTGGTLTLADGVASANIVISVKGETVIEPNEAFTVALAPGSAYKLGSRTSATGTVLNDDASSTPLAFENFSTYNTGDLKGQGGWLGDKGNTNFPVIVANDNGTKYVDLGQYQVATIAYNPGKVVPANEAKLALKLRLNTDNAAIITAFGQTASRDGLQTELIVGSSLSARVNVYAYNTATSGFDRIAELNLQLDAAQVAAEIRYVVQVSGGKISALINNASMGEATLNAVGLAATNANGAFWLQNSGPGNNAMRRVYSIAVYAPSSTIDWNYAA